MRYAIGLSVLLLGSCTLEPYPATYSPGSAQGPARGAPPPGGSAYAPVAPAADGGWLAWLGRDADRVSAGGIGRPDGAFDGHFQLALPLGPGAGVVALSVYSTDAAGAPTGGQVWHSANGAYWVLGVVTGGTQLNASHVPSLGQFAGQAGFDLYCSDSGWFRPGQWFASEAQLTDGRRLVHRVQIPGGPAAPPPVAVVAPAPPPPPPPTPVAPVSYAPSGGTFTWMGMGADQVGTWGRGTPDGAPDGQFRLRLAADGRAIASIAIYSSDASGHPQGGQIWHTANSSHWILGVARSGGRLNQSHTPSLGLHADGNPLDLYCSDSNWFKSGQWFMVEVTYADGGKLRQTTQSSAAFAVPVAQATGAAAAFTWAGIGSDQVGRSGSGVPDGSPDGHFRLSVAADGRVINSIAVYSSDAAGQPQGGQVWHTATSGYWILGVSRRGARLNQAQMPTLGVTADGYPFDLHCGDSGWFKSGQRFMVEVTYADGGKLRQTTSL